MTEEMVFVFQSTNVEVVAVAFDVESETDHESQERFVNGEQVELSLEFIYCRCSEPLSLEVFGSSSQKTDGHLLHYDADGTLRRVGADDGRGIPGEYFEVTDDEFFGIGLVRRMPPLGNKPGEVRFEVDLDTATGIVSQLLSRRSLNDFLTFRIFSEIAPDSFSPDSLLFFGTEVDPPAVSTKDSRLRLFTARLEPPTSGKTSLTHNEFVGLLKNQSARISYRQLYEVIPCKPETMKKYLVKAMLAEKGVRLTNQTFAVSELVSDLVPHLQRLEPQGEKAYSFLQLFFKAGHISKFRID
jgi:hypothetical protein